MIQYPKPGQRIRLHYRREAQKHTPESLLGIVLLAGHGPGPHNVLVQLDSGLKIVIPKGNLVDEHSL